MTWIFSLSTHRLSPWPPYPFATLDKIQRSDIVFFPEWGSDLPLTRGQSDAAVWRWYVVNFLCKITYSTFWTMWIAIRITLIIFWVQNTFRGINLNVRINVTHETHSQARCVTFFFYQTSSGKFRNSFTGFTECLPEVKIITRKVLLRVASVGTFYGFLDANRSSELAHCNSS